MEKELIDNTNCCSEGGDKVDDVTLTKLENPAKKQEEFTDATTKETLLAAAESGNSDAMARLADIYIFIEKDYENALEFAQNAANKDNSYGQFYLGYLYLYGIGVEEDNNEAFKWLNLSAEKNNSRAQYYLAQCYEKGWGCKNDIGEAKHWYKNAAEQDDDDAMAALAFIYLTESNYTETYRWAQKAAEKNNALGQCYLGGCYCVGWGCEEDFDEAMNWFKKSAEQGNSDAMWGLGNLYLKVALRWFRTAAENDDSAGQYMIGLFYENGLGVSKDLDEAQKWYKKAAEGKDKYAVAALERLQKT